MNEQIIEGEATAIAIREDDGVVRSPMTPAQARERWEEFKAMRAALAEPGDWTEFRDRSGNVKRTPNKALIKKLAFAFRISVETVENRTDTLPDGHLGVTVRARATHSATGLSCEALAGCSSMEDRFRGLKGRAYHDIVATAETRATDRAIMNLIGGGEVGTDEMMATSKPAASKPPGDEKPRGLTVAEARARKENGGGGPVAVAEAGCSECHAPAGKQHATRCSRRDSGPTARSGAYDGSKPGTMDWRAPEATESAGMMPIDVAAETYTTVATNASNLAARTGPETRDASRERADEEGLVPPAAAAGHRRTAASWMSEGQAGLLFASLRNAGYDDDESRHALYAKLTKGKMNRTADLTPEAYSAVLAFCDETVRKGAR